MNPVAFVLTVAISDLQLHNWTCFVPFRVLVYIWGFWDVLAARCVVFEGREIRGLEATAHSYASMFRDDLSNDVRLWCWNVCYNQRRYGHIQCRKYEPPFKKLRLTYSERLLEAY